MKDRLVQSLKASLGINLYTDVPADESIDGTDKHTCRDITDALVKKAKEGDTAASALILQIATFEPVTQ